jgi:hypothetical protein
MGFNPFSAIGDAARAVGHLAEESGKALEDGGKAFEGALSDAAKVAKNMSLSDLGHTALDVVGMVPVVGSAANLANAGWYAAQGDWKDAAGSAAAAIPIAGDGVDAAKLGVDAVKLGGDAVKAEEVATTATRGAGVLDSAGAAAHADQSVWVQLKNGGHIREYDPSTVQGNPTLNARVMTAEGRGEVVSVGEPPNKNDVRLPSDESNRPVHMTLTQQAQTYVDRIRKEVDAEAGAGRGGLRSSGERSGESKGAKQNIAIGRRTIELANTIKVNDKLVAELKTLGKQLINKGSADLHPQRDGRRNA